MKVVWSRPGASRPAVVGVVRQESVGNRWFGRHIGLSEVQTGKGRAVEDELGGGRAGQAVDLSVVEKETGTTKDHLVSSLHISRASHSHSLRRRWERRRLESVVWSACCTVGSTGGEEGADEGSY
jgi:hypothetical protein